MILVVHLPSEATDESTGALSLARRAPLFAVERLNGQPVAMATFPAMPAGLDLAVELVGEAVRVPEAWASINAARLTSLTKLWQRLTCYRASLAVADSTQYCMETTAHFHQLVGCERYRCPVPCQFICTPCIGLAQDLVMLVPQERYQEAAKLAEIEWCPSLRIQV